MLHMRVLQNGHEILHLHRAGPADGSDIVSAQIHQHDMLRPLLLVSQHDLGISVVLCPRPSPGTGSGYGIDLELAVVGVEEGLRRGSHNGQVTELEEVGVGAGVDASQLPVELDWIRALDPGRPGQDYLKYVPVRNVHLCLSHRILVLLRLACREDPAIHIQVLGLVVVRIYAADGLDQIDLGAGKNGSYGEVDLSGQVIEDEGALRQAELGIRGLRGRSSAQALLDQIVGQISYASAGEDLSAEAVGHAPAAGNGRPQSIEEIIALFYGALQNRALLFHIHAFREPLPSWVPCRR